MAIRQGRNTGLIVTLVFFVVAFIVSLVLAIMFYSRVEEAQKARQTADAQLRRFIDPSRAGAEEIGAYEAAGNAGDTKLKIVDYLESQLKAAKVIASGQEGIDLPTLRQALLDAGAQEGQGAIPFVLEVVADRDAKLREIDRNKTDLEAVNARIAELEKVRDQITADAAAIRDQLTKGLEQLEASVQLYKSGQDTELSNLTTNINAAKDEYLTKTSELEAKLNDTTSDLEMARSLIDDFKGRYDRSSPTAQNPSTNVDGTVIGIPVEGNVVYVDLGRKDHVVLGMRFEIYDPRRGVEVIQDDRGNVLQAGKATIEIIRIDDNSSIGRIIRSTLGFPVQPGDFVANLVYDKNRTYRFLTFGDFDIDGNGSSQDDLDMVKHIITQWGGEVIDVEARRAALARIHADGVEQDVVPFDTDFLIVGSEPVLPEKEPDPTDTAALERYKLARERRAQFNAIQAEANKLGVPILNQNRFLALVGYHNR